MTLVQHQDQTTPQFGTIWREHLTGRYAFHETRLGDQIVLDTWTGALFVVAQGAGGAHAVVQLPYRIISEGGDPDELLDDEYEDETA